MNLGLVNEITKEQMRSDLPALAPGQTVRVDVKIKEGEKERIQAFAESNGETVNGFINRLIAEAMGADKTADAPDSI